MKNDIYLCAETSGTLQIIDIYTKRASFYADKYKDKYAQCMVAFPDFDQDYFPLVLVKEWSHLLIFNFKLKKYTKVADIDT